MKTLFLGVYFILVYTVTFAQSEMLLLKRKDRTLKTYFVGSVIAFRLDYKEWKKGPITRIHGDSVYIRPMIIRYYMMGIDTTYLDEEVYALGEIKAMPKDGVSIDYLDGAFRISPTGYSVRWMWIKDGAVFMLGGAGYAALNIANGLIQNDLAFATSYVPVGIAAAVFLAGVILHVTYRPYWVMGKRYHLESYQFR